jgi:hypothetical protein
MEIKQQIDRNNKGGSASRSTPDFANFLRSFQASVLFQSSTTPLSCSHDYTVQLLITELGPQQSVIDWTGVLHKVICNMLRSSRGVSY